jgi:adenine-specific DNA-methyltransferase
VYEDGSGIHSVGDPYYGDDYLTNVIAPEGTKAIWPLFPDGREGRWQVSKDNILEMKAKGYVRMGKFTQNGMSMSYLSEGEQKKVENGDYKIIGYRKDGSIITDNSDYVPSFIPGTIWQISSHDATENGTKLLAKVIGPSRFSYPKSLYAVRDTIRFFVANKPNALILDFFAGSGTTLHAVNLLNAEDGGNRRCILVTNNEVSEQEAKDLKKKGFKPGDKEWERLGIAHYVTWPRTVCSIEGHDVNGQH